MLSVFLSIYVPTELYLSIYFFFLWTLNNDILLKLFRKMFFFPFHKYFLFPSIFWYASLLSICILSIYLYMYNVCLSFAPLHTGPDLRTLTKKDVLFFWLILKAKLSKFGGLWDPSLLQIYLLFDHCVALVLAVIFYKYTCWPPLDQCELHCTLYGYCHSVTLLFWYVCMKAQILVSQIFVL